MTKTYVLDLSGKKLFEGTRHECKRFVRKNQLKRYRFTTKFVEKKVVVEAPVEPVREEHTTLFSKIFEKDE